MSDKRGFTTAEAASYLGVTEWSLQKAMRDNTLAARKFGSRTLFDKAELDRFFDALPEKA